jgi:polyhydroxybutyrate depolymerase
MGGMQRTYQVIRPDHPVAATLPAIVVLHGVDAGIDIEEQRDGFLSLASSGQAVLVYPVGYGQSWNAGSCCGAAQAQGVDDVSFLSAMIGQIAATPGVNRGRIDLVGFSNGGRMAYQLICEKPGPLAAMAVVAALPDSTSCAAGPPLSLLQVAGADDPDISSFQVDAQVATWRARDGCTSSSIDQSLSGLTTQRWGGCQAGADVELATYDGVSHIWPPGGDGAPPTGQLIWQFFTSQPGH